MIKKALSNSRLKLYLIFVFVSLILLFVSIWQVKPIIVEPNDFFGLASHLPAYYWIGLVLLLFCSIFAFLDRSLKGDYLFIFILLTLGLFLYGIAVFGTENSRSEVTYYPIAEVKNLLTMHHFDLTAPYSLNAYRSWPGIHFLSASILLVSGLELDFVKYMPLFWMVCFILLTYCLGKRLGWPASRCFLFSFLSLSSYLAMQANFTPQGIAFILYLLCFVLIVSHRRGTAESIIITLTFIALVLFHALTMLAVLLPLIVLSIYKREIILAIIFSVIFLAWYIYQASGVFESGITLWWANPFGDFFRMADVARYVAPKPLPGLVSRYMQLSYLALYGLGILGAFALNIFRDKDTRNKIIPVFCWLAGIALLALVPYGGTLEVRLYLFGVVPAAAFLVLSYSNRILLIGLMVIFLALNIPTRYGGDVVWGQVLSTELAGAKFVALETPPGTTYFYDFSNQFMAYYDPDRIMVYDLGGFSSGSDTDISKLDDFDLAIISKQTRDRKLWMIGSEPYDDWLQTEAGKKANLIYNNGYYQIYVNEGTR